MVTAEMQSARPRPHQKKFYDIGRTDCGARPPSGISGCTSSNPGTRIRHLAEDTLRCEFVMATSVSRSVGASADVRVCSPGFGSRLVPPMEVHNVQRLIAVVVLALVILALVAHAAGQAPGAQARKLKLHISVDMEGVAGAVTGEQLGPNGFEYGRFREFATREALAAVEAAKEAGATEIIVADSHGNGQNLLIDLFPPDVRIIRSWPRRLGMVAGIDETVDAALFIGYHAGTNNPAGVRAHTFSSGTLTRVALNGTDVTEGSWNAAIAGHFGVPVVMMSGDDAAIAEVRKVVGPIEGAETKRSLGFHSAITITPQASYGLIRDHTRAALGRLSDFKPLKVQTPVTVDVSFKNYLPSEVLAYLPIFERTDSHSIRFRARDMVEASAIMSFIGDYRPDLTP
jgi:D-amino peptidase